MIDSAAAGAQPVSVLICRPDPGAPGAVRAAATAGGATVPAALAGLPALHVGPRPGKQIDAELAGRLIVVGDDADLAAVVLRLLRRDLLPAVEVGYVPGASTAATRLWGLPERADAQAACAIAGVARSAPLVRDDAGGVLVADGRISPLEGPVYVDEHRVLGGPAHELRVAPDATRGLAVTITVHPRRVPLLGRRPVTALGRAVQIATTPTTVVRDGVPHPRPMTRWTWYLHTEPLRVVRP